MTGLPDARELMKLLAHLEKKPRKMQNGSVRQSLTGYTDSDSGSGSRLAV
jgi:hypothetical protein